MVCPGAPGSPGRPRSDASMTAPERAPREIGRPLSCIRWCRQLGSGREAAEPLETDPGLVSPPQTGGHEPRRQQRVGKGEAQGGRRENTTQEANRRREKGEREATANLDPLVL